jgi:type IV pilus biogenesis protein CpaD/CtpE
MATFIESGEIQTRACGVIWSLSMNSNDRKDVAQLGGCQAILEAMLVNPDDDALQVMALGALKVLSFNVVGQFSLRKISASSVVAGSMQRHISNTTIQSEGCAIICNLATEPNHFIIPVTEEEIDAVVHSILSHPESSSTQEGAIFALMILSSSTVNIELMRQNAKLYEALYLAFSRHPDVVGRDIQVLFENLKTEPPRTSNV